MRNVFIILLFSLLTSCATDTYVMHSHDPHHPHYYEHKHKDGSDPDMEWEKHDDSAIYDDCRYYHYDPLFQNHWHNCYWD